MLVAQHGIAQHGGSTPPPVGNTEFKFQVTTTSPSQSITIPHLSGSYVYNYIVDYGDGTVLPVTSWNDPNCNHTYTVASAHTVTISGICETFYVNWSGTMPSTLTRILQWGNVGFIKLNMWGCTSLLSIPTDTIGGFRKITNFDYGFGYCYQLTSIPANLLDYATGATSMYGLFYYCPYIQSIPADLLKYNTLVTNFGWAFYGYASGVGLRTVPTDMFRYNTAVTTFSGVFYNSYLIIPAGLFKYNLAVQDFSQAFAYSGAITSIPEGLFTGNTSATSFAYTFISCNGLTTLPSKLFPVSANYFYQTFRECGNLTAIPLGLFTGCTYANTFYETFYGCINITASLPELWVQFPSANGTNCFALDVNAANYSAVPEEWGGIAINFKLQVTTTGYNQSVTMPHLSGYTHNYVIDYGDGYGWQTVTSYNDPDCTHTYYSPSTYTIKVSGVCETFFMKNTDTIFSGLTKVINWGRVKMKKMNFSGCTTLNHIASNDPLYGLSGITNFTNIFANCVNIDNPAPALWKQYSAATGTDCFLNDTKLYNYTYIPTAWGGLGGTATPLKFEIQTPGNNPYPMYIPHREKSYDNTYKYNFDYYIDWGDGTGIFHVSSYNDANTYHYYATGGTWTISISGICETIDCWQGTNTYYFTQSLKKVKQWGQVQMLVINFMQCQQMTAVEATDGKGISLITDWTYAFYYCTSLTGITATMFSGCTKARTFQYLFYNDYNLLSIPLTLFDDCILGYYFYGTFFQCTGLTGAAPELWNRTTPYPVPQDGYCFAGCTGLSNYAAAQAAGWA
jgi:hypothetical protein